MHLKLNLKTFEQHLSKIEKALISSNPFPALSGVILIATESNLQIIASNGNLSIREIMELSLSNKVFEPGKILVPGRLFIDAIKKHGEILELKVNNQKTLELLSNDLKMSINLLNFEDYPKISFDLVGKDFEIDVQVFNRLIKNVAFAAAVNDKRIILNGVNLRAENGLLFISATNSYRLAQQKYGIDSHVDFNLTILARDLKNFLPDKIEGNIRVFVNDTKAITSHQSTTVISNLIDGLYPDVNKLIPQATQLEIEISVQELKSLLEKISVIVDESQRVIRLSIKGQEMILQVNRAEVGHALIKSQNFRLVSGGLDHGGIDFTIAFNIQFLKDAISCFEKNILIGFNGNDKPFIIKGSSQENLVQMILPHRVF